MNRRQHIKQFSEINIQYEFSLENGYPKMKSGQKAEVIRFSQGNLNWHQIQIYTQ